MAVSQRTKTPNTPNRNHKKLILSLRFTKNLINNRNNKKFIAHNVSATIVALTLSLYLKIKLNVREKRHFADIHDLN